MDGAEILAAAKAAGPPSCLAGFAAELLSGVAHEAAALVRYRLRCLACREDGFLVHAYPEMIEGELFLLPPHALTCAGCGRREPVFDPRTDGYDGALGHVTGYECGEGQDTPGPGVFRMTVLLGFNIDWKELRQITEETGVAPGDLFDWFTLRGEPEGEGAPLELDYECA